MERAGGRKEWRMVYGAVVLLVAAAFLYSVAPVLSPFVLFLLLLLLVSPFAGTRQHLLLVSGSALLTTLWLLRTAGSVLAPFILALVLAYIIDPVVGALERRRVPRGLGVLLLGLPFVVIVASAVFLGVPALARQTEGLIARAPETIDRLVAWAESVVVRVRSVDLPFLREEVVLEQLRSVDATRVVGFLRDRREAIARGSWEAVLGFGRGIGALVGLLGYVVLTPVLVYYLVRDWHTITARLRALVPERLRPQVYGFAEEYDTLLSRYLRGQIFAAATVGVLTWLLLWILRFPYAGLVGAVAGVFNLVPYVGLVVSLVPAILISLLSGSILLSLLKVAGVFAVVQTLDSTVIGPRIVGGSVGLHPVWVLLALAAGGYFLGFVGLLVAMPTAVLLKLVIRHALARYQRSALYAGEGSGGGE